MKLVQILFSASTSSSIYSYIHSFNRLILFVPSSPFSFLTPFLPFLLSLSLLLNRIIPNQTSIGRNVEFLFQPKYSDIIFGARFLLRMVLRQAYAAEGKINHTSYDNFSSPNRTQTARDVKVRPRDLAVENHNSLR